VNTGSYVARLKQHIEAHYTKQELEVGSTGSVIPTCYLHALYYKLLNFLGYTGFAKIKVSLLLVWDITTIAYTILNVEFSLRMNNIDGIYNILTPDQLIPVIIDVCVIGTAVTEIYLCKRKESAERENQGNRLLYPQD